MNAHYHDAISKHNTTAHHCLDIATTVSSAPTTSQSMLQELQQATGYTIIEIAQNCQLSASFLYRLLRGEIKYPSFTKFRKLNNFYFYVLYHFNGSKKC